MVKANEWSSHGKGFNSPHLHQLLRYEVKYMKGIIYKITNITNGKVYIGATTKTLETRWNEHKQDYIRRRYEKRPLYSAMKKYGIENFQIEVLEECDEDLVFEREVYFISKYNSYEGEGYNATPGGEGRPIISKEEELEIIETFHKTETIRKTAKIFGRDEGTISKILKKHEVDTYQYIKNGKQGDLQFMPQKVYLIEKRFIF